MDKKHKRLINVADKYVRQKAYNCLFPGCTRKAINSHSIPRASCVEALSENGVLFSLRQSHNQMIRMVSPSDPLDVVAVGVGDAGTFKGYCPEHDLKLFRSVETEDPRRKNGMQISLHLRALSLEYCRNRQARDFIQKFCELTDQPKLRDILRQSAAQFEARLIGMKVYLDSTFGLILGSPIDSVKSFTLPFARNLQVSCCGCLNDHNEFPEALYSTIAFNLISYSDMSFLSLTVFQVVEKYLKSFLAKFALPHDAERLVNEIAFLRCEEPLISAKLWRSLTDTQRDEIRLFLRAPYVRSDGAPAPAVIKLGANDLAIKITPELMARLGYPRARLENVTPI